MFKEQLVVLLNILQEPSLLYSFSWFQVWRIRRWREYTVWRGLRECLGPVLRRTFWRLWRSHQNNWYWIYARGSHRNRYSSTAFKKSVESPCVSKHWIKAQIFFKEWLTLICCLWKWRDQSHSPFMAGSWSQTSEYSPSKIGALMSETVVASTNKSGLRLTEAAWVIGLNCSGVSIFGICSNYPIIRQCYSQTR